MDAHEFGSSMRLLHVLPITTILELARNKSVTLTMFPNVLSSQISLGSCEHHCLNQDHKGASPSSKRGNTHHSQHGAGQ